jgi:hypothetical protein
MQHFFAVAPTWRAKFAAISAIITVLTVAALVVLRAYKLSVLNLLSFGLGVALSTFLLAYTSECTRSGGCRKLSDALALSSLVVCILFIVTLP